MRSDAGFDVLVIGSGAAGLAAEVSAERSGARVGLATKTTLQANNSANWSARTPNCLHWIR